MQQTLIMSPTTAPAADDTQDAYVVSTPLDAIIRLERRHIRTVVLAGAYARNGELAASLHELYPSIRIEREE